MLRSKLVLVALLAAAPLRATAAPPALDERAPAALDAAAPLAALPPLAPVGREAVAAADGGGGGIVMSALYGGLAGALVGTGIGLVENGNYGRDIAIGAGAGILVGAAFGAAHALGDSRGVASATDGLGTPDRDPVITARTLGLRGRF